MTQEQVDGWFRDDIVRHCIPDFSGGNWKRLAIDSWHSERG